MVVVAVPVIVTAPTVWLVVPRSSVPLPLSASALVVAPKVPEPVTSSAPPVTVVVPL